MGRSASTVVGFVIAFGAGLLLIAVYTPRPSVSVPTPGTTSSYVPALAEPTAMPAEPVASGPPALDVVVRGATADLVRLRSLSPPDRDRELRHWAVIGQPRFGLLERGGGRFVGERVAYRGRVEEIHDLEGAGSAIRFSIDSGRQQVLWVETLEPAPDWVVRDVRALIAGYVVGEHTYETQMGALVTLPAIVAVGIVQPGT